MAMVMVGVDQIIKELQVVHGLMFCDFREGLNLHCTIREARVSFWAAPVPFHQRLFQLINLSHLYLFDFARPA